MSSISTELERTPLNRRNLLFAAFSAAVILAAFRPLQQLVRLSLDWDNSHLSYILLIPFISATLVFMKKDEIFAHLRHSIVPATIVFLLGASLIYAAQISAENYLTIIIGGVVVVWLGGFLIAYGVNAFRQGLFPLLFLLLIVPLPDAVVNSVTTFLQKGSADVVAVLFSLTQTPAFREGVIFRLPGVTIEVAEACSGIRSTLGIVIICLVAAHLSLRSNWKRVALLLTVVPISLFKNAVRIVTLTILAIRYDKRFLTGSLHHDGGVIFMLIGLMAMYPILAFLVKLESKNSGGVPS